ncbi:MAG: transglycosylase SLT domain-containing protein [Ignavibacteriae bacterium]|nr:transglycosylase SLT domain-containing protein [Ignavibacteriota bacterium]
MNSLELKITKPESHIKQGKIAGDRYSKEEKTKLAQASKDFESMLTAMMLKSMTKTTDGLFGNENYGGDVLDVLFETEIAKHISNSKGMGIADKIFNSMTGDNIKDYNKKNVKNNKINEVDENVTKAIKDIENTKPSNNALKRIEKFEPIINEASHKYDVDKKLIKSIILTESAGIVNAKSKANAKGLMQLMDSTASDMGVINPFDPKDNINGGVKYISKLLKQFDGNTNLALAAYNAGPGNVNKYDGIPPFKETQNYIARVNNYLNILE